MCLSMKTVVFVTKSCCVCHLKLLQSFLHLTNPLIGGNVYYTLSRFPDDVIHRVFNNLKACGVFIQMKVWVFQNSKDCITCFVILVQNLVMRHYHHPYMITAWLQKATIAMCIDYNFVLKHPLKTACSSEVQMSCCCFNKCQAPSQSTSNS